MTRLARVAITIRGTEPTKSERRLEKIVDFFEIERRTLTPELAAVEGRGTHGPSSPYTVLISAARLAELIPLESATGMMPGLLRQAESVFVFDFDGSPASRPLLGSLTGVADESVDIRRLSSPLASVSSGVPELCGALSGITAERSAADDGRTFVGVRRSDGFRSVISSGDGDVFFECRRAGARLFLSVAGPSLDIDGPVEGTYFDVRPFFSSIVPLVIFLKGAFAGAVGSGRVTSASLIVDDPILKRRYGFLRFGEVLAAMAKHDFSTTIAFIPWNWRRTNRQTADLFLQNDRRYSLAIHGCDHTAGEFGSRSLASLNHKIKAARRRADRHLQVTGVRVSPIMVFPQGVYSPEAAYVLKCNNFIAAVNTEVNPVGDGIPHTLVRELWDVAIMQYSSFPIFTRRYISHGLENFAFDAFLGKPCLLVAHHDVFKNEARDLIAFIGSLNSLAGGVRWGTLEQVITRSYVSRGGADGRRHIRMFANEIVLDGSNQDEGVVVEKRESDRTTVARVICDRREVDWAWHSGVLRFRIDPPVRPASVVRVEYIDPIGNSSARESARYRIGVGVRRYLSEMRDDYICRSELMNRYADKVMRLLK